MKIINIIEKIVMFCKIQDWELVSIIIALGIIVVMDICISIQQFLGRGK
jgi:hypothetical protein